MKALIILSLILIGLLAALIIVAAWIIFLEEEEIREIVYGEEVWDDAE